MASQKKTGRNCITHQKDRSETNRRKIEDYVTSRVAQQFAKGKEIKKLLGVKFNDMDNRQKIYQPEFHQADGPGILVHESLADRRTRMVTTQREMKR